MEGNRKAGAKLSLRRSSKVTSHSTAGGISRQQAETGSSRAILGRSRARPPRTCWDGQRGAWAQEDRDKGEKHDTLLLGKLKNWNISATPRAAVTSEKWHL